MIFRQKKIWNNLENEYCGDFSLENNQNYFMKQQ